MGPLKQHFRTAADAWRRHIVPQLLLNGVEVPEGTPGAKMTPFEVNARTSVTPKDMIEILFLT